jgi:hypothetical protein
MSFIVKRGRKVAIMVIVIVKLLNELPEDIQKEWLTAKELCDCLVKGGVPTSINENDVRYALGKIDKGTFFQPRDYHRTKYYRHQAFHSLATTPDSRQNINFLPLAIESGYFDSSNYAADIEAIKRYATEGSAKNETACDNSVSATRIVSPFSTRNENDAHGITLNASADTPCRGWSGNKYSDIIALSIQDHVSRQRENGQQITPPTGRIPLATLFSGRKDYNKMELDVSPTTEAVIRARECLGSNDGTLCDVCKVISRSVALLKRQASPEIELHGKMHITPERIMLMGPEKSAAAVQTVRSAKNDEIRLLKMKLQRIEENCAKSETAMELEHQDDMDILKRVAHESLPIAAKIWGRDSTRYHVFSTSFKDLRGEVYDKDGNVTSGMRYNPECFTKAMVMLREYKERAYAPLAKMLYFPTPRHLRASMKKLLGNNDGGAQIEPICHEKEIWSQWAVENPTISEGWNDIGVEYDSMKISPGMVLTRRTEEKNRLQGAILPENMDISTRLFDQFVFKVAEERGVGPTSDEDPMESVADMLVLNTEHSVYYAVSMNPYCKMAFIAGMYNSSTLTSDKITYQMDDVTRALLVHGGMNKRSEVSDSAGCNEGYVNEWYDIPALEYIPAQVLAKHGLNGVCMVAYIFYGDGEPVFGFDDPPHVLKRVGNAMRNKDLQWGDGFPMTMGVLGDLYNAVVMNEDAFSLKRYRKLSPSLFDKDMNRSMKMKVSPIAKVLSNTMVQVIDEVCNNESIDFAHVPFQQRKATLAPVQNLCRRMNRWFDLCNSKDPEKRGKKGRPVWVTRYNAVEIADEFLDTLKWLQDWRNAVTVNGVLQKQHFLPDETYESLQRCCYGFASLIYYWVIGKGRMLLLSRVNQDIVENHFGHLRAAGGRCIKPNESSCNAGGKTSGLKRLDAASKSANVTLDLHNMMLA